MRVILLFCFMLATGFAMGQNTPVKWTFEAEKINDGEYEIVARADIQSGWAVYSKDMKGGGPTPTQVMLRQSGELKIVGDVVEVGQKKTEYDKMFDMELIKLSGRTYFKQRIKVSGDLDEISGRITYMTCCEESCLPPTDIAFNIPLD